MDSVLRQELIDAILTLVPPRPGDERRARESLERRDEAFLRGLKEELGFTPQSSAQGQEPDQPSARQIEARRKLASGLSKLVEATDRLEKIRLAAEPTVNKSAPRKSSEVRPTDRIYSQLPSEPSSIMHRPSSHRIGDWWAPRSPISYAIGAGKTRLHSQFAINSFATNEEENSTSEATVQLSDLHGIVLRYVLSIAGHSQVRDARRVADDIYERLAHDPAIRKYLQVNSAGIIRDTLAMAVARGIISSEDGLMVPWSLRSWLEMSPYLDETTFLPNPSNVLGETAAIDAFAKMVVCAREFDPQYVVMLKGGGQLAGGLVQHTLNESIPFLVLDLNEPRAISQINTERRAERLLLIDDVSRTGGTMSEGLRMCRAIFGTADVKGIGLVGTAESAQTLGDDVFFPALAGNMEVELPWDRRGQYHSTPEEHILGYGRPTSLPIGKVLFERTVGRLSYAHRR